MNFRRSLIASLTLAVAGFSTFNAFAADAWPDHPVTLVVPFAAGGPTDALARSIAAAITKGGHNVIVENRAGAGGTVGSAYVKNAKPDGYTFLLHHIGMSTAPALYRKLAFNPLTDFEYVSQVANVPMTLIARKDFPPKDVKELISYIKANKTKINIGDAGLGSASQLCGMMFKKTIDTEVTAISYGGTGPAMNGLLGGQIDLMCDQTTNTLSQIKGGGVKVYAVTTAQRIKTLPNVPTLSEGGLKGFEVVIWHGIYAPKGTPKPIIDSFNKMIRAALKNPDTAKNLDQMGVEQVADSKLTPEGLQSWLKTEIDKYGPVIRDAKQFAD